MIKRCIWKGQRVSCSAIFSMYPTNRGMCCTFNKQKADELFRANRYQEQITRMTKQDKDHSFEDSGVPDWLSNYVEYHIGHTLSITFNFRFDRTPETGKDKGLVLMLDAHSDKVTASSIPDNFHGFEAIIDSKAEFPLTTRKNILISPGHTVSLQ